MAGFMLRHEMWATWAGIAIRERDAAQAARDAMTPPPADLDLTPEFEASLVAVCAAAFSIEALQRRLRTMTTVPRLKKPNTENWLRAVLGASLIIDPDPLVVAFAPTIERRGAAAHYADDFAEPVPHPIGHLMTQAMVDYSVEGATEAVDAMRDIYAALRDHPTPGAVAMFAEQNAHVFAALGVR